MEAHRVPYDAATRCTRSAVVRPRRRASAADSEPLEVCRPCLRNPPTSPHKPVDPAPRPSRTRLMALLARLTAKRSRPHEPDIATQLVNPARGPSPRPNRSSPTPQSNPPHAPVEPAPRPSRTRPTPQSNPPQEPARPPHNSAARPSPGLGRTSLTPEALPPHSTRFAPRAGAPRGRADAVPRAQAAGSRPGLRRPTPSPGPRQSTPSRGLRQPTPSPRSPRRPARPPEWPDWPDGTPTSPGSGRGRR
ncbi:hypothetical protein ATK74_0557 [Propionicimonas paludicola]|uniref:Uncharacterized protein n=1 Tax=Propionicimonas paludicola TaxID=185243 RepID=A0A2A9CQZ2_9ACTN|nr:hypothetical protein ATK74_0557 [Propionicimonas paludicola]